MCFKQILRIGSESYARVGGQMNANTTIPFEALTPVEMTAKAEQVGVKKGQLTTAQMFVLALLAGIFIGFGAIFSTTAIAGAGPVLPFGITRLVAGIAFAFGLVLVVVSGAELFTGNTLMVVAWANRKLRIGPMLKNWLIVYLGNFLGSLGLAALVYASGQFSLGKGAIGTTALAIAAAKVELGFGQAIALGILANILVCMAVWLSFSARTTTDQVLALMPPVAAFVAAGFEHSVANMYFVPVGLLIKNGAAPAFWTTIGKTPENYPNLTWEHFLVGNLLPVTLGNIIGGVLCVGLAYWFVFVRLPVTRATPPIPAHPELMAVS